jgi:flagellar protein FliT
VESAILDHYRALEAASRQMLGAARQERWDEVARLEQTAREMIVQLREAAARHSLSAEELSEKMCIMQRIVLVDAEVRHLAQPWLAGLDRILGQSAPRGIEP